ncbi:hypothetical protein V5F89_00905 [Pelagerythrobacter marensis]|uniref:OmpA-like domain-containing protein n=1 Tax=Pelagerythrobacter marensis TaxID=543877 RepID=A0ABZ2D3A9_9SPHN
MRALSALLALVAPASLLAHETGDLVEFVSCPVYRDTDAGRKSGCWLAYDGASGTRWDVSQSPYKPDYNFAVLVEGRVSAEAGTLCGAAVLDPVRTSRLSIRCPAHMLPAEGFPGRKYSLPERNIAPLAVQRDAPPGPYKARKFYTFFEFDRDFLVYQYDDYLLDKAVTWIKAAQPKKLIVTGFAATEPVIISGRPLAERPETAESRARRVSLALSRLLPGIEIETRWQTGSLPVDAIDADGLPMQSQRRTEIEAVF